MHGVAHKWCLTVECLSFVRHLKRKRCTFFLFITRLLYPLLYSVNKKCYTGIGYNALYSNDTKRSAVSAASINHKGQSCGVFPMALRIGKGG